MAACPSVADATYNCNGHCALADVTLVHGGHTHSSVADASPRPRSQIEGGASTCTNTRRGLRHRCRLHSLQIVAAFTSDSVFFNASAGVNGCICRGCCALGQPHTPSMADAPTRPCWLTRRGGAFQADEGRCMGHRRVESVRQPAEMGWEASATDKWVRLPRTSGCVHHGCTILIRK